MKIQEDALNVIARSTVEGNVLFLPPGQLDRKLYLSVNKVLTSIGGKWNRGKKGHVFESDPSDVLDEIINTGEFTDAKKEFQFFETPGELAKKMVDMAEILDRDVLMEPSAGNGRILNEFPLHGGNEFIVYDLNPNCVQWLQDKGYYVALARDFLEEDAKADVIVMNPPFTKQQDVKHILHAWDCLNHGGRLVSIVSESPFFRENKLSKQFREWLDENNATVIRLDPGTFKESGTMVNTRLIKVIKE